MIVPPAREVQENEMRFVAGLTDAVRRWRGSPLVIPLVLLLGTAFIAGCANQAKMANDPFRKTSQRGNARQLPNDPRYAFDTPQHPVDRANALAREKDIAADLSTDPAHDEPDLKEAADEEQIGPTSSRKPASDPLFQNEADAAIRPRTSSAGGDPLGSSAGQTPFADYEKLRGRLDAAGATNWKFDRDDVAGETTFSCEAPYPDNQTTYRVFEAKSKDELKAMLAVAEQVERWSLEQKQR